MGLPGGTALTGLSECGPGFNPPFREALLLSSKAAGGTVVKNSLANAGDTGHGFDPRVRKVPWRRKWQPTPVSLPGKSREQRSLAGYSPQSMGS